jgi:hypothetical protein
MEVLSSPSESALNFVKHKEDIMFIADFAESTEVSRRSGDVSTFAEERFDDYRSCVFWRGLLGEEGGEVIEGCLDYLFGGRVYRKT